MSDPYEVLGVRRGSSEIEVRRAYHRLAREHHPDTNPDDEGAEEQFKRIQEAYRLITSGKAIVPPPGASGPRAPRAGEHREPYPAGPPPPPPRVRPGAGVAGPGVRPPDADASAPRDVGAPAPFEGRGRDREVTLPLGFDQSFDGDDVVVEAMLHDRCDACSGIGRVSTAGTRCTHCQGTGYNSSIGRVPLTCTRCDGTGHQPPPACGVCGGRGLLRQQHRYRVRVPPGIDDGARIRLPGKGDASQAGPRGDLYAIVRLAPDLVFSRDGVDLEVVVPLRWTTAVLGGRAAVPIPEGGTRQIRVPPGVDVRARQRLTGYGMPRLGADGRGDLLCQFEIEVPGDLDERVRDLVERLDALLDEVEAAADVPAGEPVAAEPVADAVEPDEVGA